MALSLEIITPDSKVYQGQVSSATLPGSEGMFGILTDHAPMIAALKSGIISLTEIDNSTKEFMVKGGIVEVLNNKVTVLAEQIIK